MAARADIVGDVTADRGRVEFPSDGAEFELRAVVPHHHLVTDEPFEDELRRVETDDDRNGTGPKTTLHVVEFGLCEYIPAADAAEGVLNSRPCGGGEFMQPP